MITSMERKAFEPIDYYSDAAWPDAHSGHTTGSAVG